MVVSVSAARQRGAGARPAGRDSWMAMAVRAAHATCDGSETGRGAGTAATPLILAVLRTGGCQRKRCAAKWHRRAACLMARHSSGVACSAGNAQRGEAGVAKLPPAATEWVATGGSTTQTKSLDHSRSTRAAESCQQALRIPHRRSNHQCATNQRNQPQRHASVAHCARAIRVPQG